jgi:hypothetical protein
MSITLTSYNGVDERLERIAAQCSPKVIALHNHKGFLSVNWLMTPTTAELAAVVKAWTAEFEVWSSHFVCGVPLIVDDDYNPFKEGERLER